jgi:hypothetical protein
MQRRSFPTAGLRQPLLIGRRTFTAKRVLADAQTHVPRSGGRQPAVVCDTDAVPRKSSIAQRLTNTRPGAAGVSPPWCATPTPCRENRTSCGDLRTRNQERRASARRGRRNAHATAFVSHGWLTPAAPDRATNIHCKARAWRCTNARAQERRASARRGVRYQRCAGKIEHCAATNEHVPKSGGRQPAVVGETLMQRRSFHTAGLRQPLLIGRRTFTAKRVLGDAQTRVPRSGEHRALLASHATDGVSWQPTLHCRT